MGKRGRLSKEAKNAPIDPQRKKDADDWMKVIGDEYEEIKNACRVNAHKQKKEWNEDVFQNSIILCYDSITRNGIKDKTSQGCRNYLFRAYNTNIIHNKVNGWNARISDNEDAVEQYNLQVDVTVDKIREELLNDYSVIYILRLVEDNFDAVSFYCFRLRFLMPKMTYNRLVKLTNIKNAKTRVKNILTWLRDNITEQDIFESFENNFQID